MSFLKKNTTRIPTLQEDIKRTKVVALATKKPLTALLVIAAVPLLVLIGFTFKSGLNTGKATQKLVVRQTNTELADQATELLQKHDTNGFLEMLEQKLDSNVNIVNSKGDPILLVAATLGQAEAVRHILLAGADVNKRNTFTKDTALLRALYFSDNSEIARLLVNFGADINAVNNYGHSPLFLALEKQRGELIDLFLANGVAEGLNSAYLFRASAKQNIMGVLAMLKGGIDPNVSNEKGNTPLIISSSLGDLTSVRNLLAYRADINAANQDGNTALIYASRYNHPEVVRELLKPQTLQAPVNINAQNKLGQTALYWAASKGYTDIVKRLLAADADSTLAANDGLIPYTIAQKKKHTAVLPWFEKSITEVKNSVIEADNAAMIAQAKAEGLDLPDAQKETAAVTDADLFKAAETGDLDLARRVVAQNKAVVFNKNAEGDTALLVAVKNGKDEVVDFLLRNSARLFEASSKGNVFHIATQAQNLDMLKHLVQLARQEGRLSLMLEYKANISDKGPLSPLGLSAEICNKEIYDYLVSQGAKPGVKTGATSGVLSPADLLALCKSKPTQAKQLTPTKNTKRDKTVKQVKNSKTKNPKK